MFSISEMPEYDFAVGSFLWIYINLLQPKSCFTEKGQDLYVLCETCHCRVAQYLLTLAAAALWSSPSGKISITISLLTQSTYWYAGSRLHSEGITVVCRRE